MNFTSFLYKVFTTNISGHFALQSTTGDNRKETSCNKLSCIFILLWGVKRFLKKHKLLYDINHYGIMNIYVLFLTETTNLLEPKQCVNKQVIRGIPFHVLI